MKKNIFLGFILVLSIAILGGCGSDAKETKKVTKKSNIKTLACILEENKDSSKTMLNINFEYNEKDKEFTQGSALINIVVPKEQINNYKEVNICDIFSKTFGQSFENCKSSINENNIKLYYDINLDKLEGISENGGFEKSMTIDEAKKSLEEQKMKCEIK